jgi:VCBS repeat protein/FG-GAP repeat protein
MARNCFHFASRLLALAALTLGWHAPRASAQCDSVSLDGSRSYPALGGSQQGAAAVATGDFDDDGKPDIVVATPENDGVSVFLNERDGYFGMAAAYPSGRFPNHVAVGDFDGDGRLDLVTANGGANSVSVLPGNGDGTFQPARNSPAGLLPHSVAVGDFNRDGKLDAAIAGGSSAIGAHQLWVLLGNGDGTFQAPIANTTVDYQYFVIAADFNADGNLDLVAGSGIQIWIHLGNGDGTFQPPVTIVSEGGSPYGSSIAVGDFNADGHPDLAIANSTHQASGAVPGTVSVLLGSGNGAFLPPLAIEAGTFPYAVAASDFDRDGRLDLAVASTGDARVSIFSGNGDGTFGPSTDYPVGANWAVSLAVSDFNGDAKPDVAVSSAFTDNVSVLLSKPGGGFHSAARFGTGKQPYAIVTGDFDDDGELDLAVANTGSTVSALPGTISVLLGNGDGSFGPAVDYEVGRMPAFIATRDFDRDGRLDLAVVNRADANIGVLLGNGDGTFQTGVNYAVGANAISVVVADLDLDGLVDFATGSLGAGNTNQVSVLIGNGDGTFRPMVNSTVPGSGITAVAAGDVDGDGRPDLAVANYNSSNIAIMLGNGDGTFHPASSTLAAAGPVSIAMRDLDGDARADLAVGNFATRMVSIARGDGSGGFQTIGDYAVGNDPLGRVATDLNGDSKVDLAVANVNDHYVSILQGKGDGTFHEALHYGTGKGPSDIAVGDFDRDGKPDLAMTGYWFNEVSILLNDCTVTPVSVVGPEPAIQLAPMIDAIVPNPARALAWVDYSIPVRSFVDLSVFDLAGRKVETVVSGLRDPGRYRLPIDSSTLPPGSYWCRLSAGGMTRSRSLVIRH